MQLMQRIILSKKFLPGVFVFFALQAVFYATFVGYGIPSDETYHFGASSYYAEQPISTGPFTHNQDPSTIPVIRAIDRDPSYLYHYVLSFPIRAMQAFDLSVDTQVTLLRFINIVLALLALYVLKKCLDEISEDRLLKNLTVFFLSLSGMVVWLAGAVNYDNFANLLFLLFVWATIRIIKKPEPLTVLAASLLAMATVLSKYTFAPVLFASLLVTLVLVWRRYSLAMFWTGIRKNLSARRALSISLILLNLVFFGLFVERIGINLLRYHSVESKCDKFFTAYQCRSNNVYNRNFRQHRQFSEDNKKALMGGFDPFSFAGQWTYTMYNTLYFQLGDRRFESTPLTRIFAAVLAMALAVTAILSRARIRLGKAASYVLFLTCFYIALLFLYNLKTLFSYGMQFGFQGRYLLPVLGFLYFFAGMMTINTYRNRRPRSRRIFAWTWIIVLTLFFAVHFPPYRLAVGTDPSWKDDYMLQPEVID